MRLAADPRCSSALSTGSRTYDSFPCDYSASHRPGGSMGVGGEVAERASSSERVFTPIPCRIDRRVVRVVKVGKISLTLF